MFKNKYNDFKSSLYQLIQQNAPLNDIGQMIFADPYCNDLSQIIANKYNVEALEILSEAYLDICNQKLLVPVISQQQEFNGRIFKLSLTDIAARLKGRVMMSLNDDETIEFENNESYDGDVHDRPLRLQRFEDTLQIKLQELENYKSKLISPRYRVDINVFADIIQLKAENVLQRFGATRQSINNYKPQLATLMTDYINLYSFWYRNQESYLNKILNQYENYKAIYRKLAPNISYKTFISSMEQPTVWDLQNLYNQLGDDLCLT